VIVTTFASSVHRINIILQIAEKQGRVVSLLGRSMINVVAHARRLGYIRCKEETLQPMHVINQLSDSEVIVLTTGSQGEPTAALTRIANGEHPQLKIKPGDTVICSANPIPGNVIPVTRLIDKLMTLGAHVIYGKEKGIHVSGHGCQEEQKLMLALTKPRFFVPTHGEYRMLAKHADTAVSMGMARENIVIINNGDVVAVQEDGIEVVDKVPAGIQLLDESRGGIVVDKVLQERQQIAKDGLITVAASVDATGQLLYESQVHAVGLTADIRLLTREIRYTLEQSLQQEWPQFARSMEKNTLDIDWAGLKDALERSIRRLVRDRLQGKPTVVLMMQTPEPLPAASSPAPQSSLGDLMGEVQAAARSRKRRSAAAVAS
jgi:ribonuclease J